MVKLDATVLRYMSKDELRVLTAIEMGMKNHELVPTVLIARISHIKHNNINKLINNLHKNKLIRHEAQLYDGYKLTYLGYDYLALYTLVQRGLITGIGRRIGVGKESDIYECYNSETDEVLVLKIHRLGRVCFRAVKSLRDYLQHRKSASWLYLSRLAAQREYSYMRALYDNGFSVPVPYDCNRHCVLMSCVRGYPFGQVSSLRHVSNVYSQLMDMIIRLAEYGLIHCDFNEFNLLIDDDEVLTMIDFPQMVSTSHANAAEYFARDVQCIQTYFAKKFGYLDGEMPVFDMDTERKHDLDVELHASGVDTQIVDEFEKYVAGRQTAGQHNDVSDSDEDTLEQQLDAQYAGQLDSADIDAIQHAHKGSVDAAEGEVDNYDNTQSNSSDAAEHYDKDTERRERNHAKKAALRQKHALRQQRKQHQHTDTTADHTPAEQSDNVASTVSAGAEQLNLHSDTHEHKCASHQSHTDSDNQSGTDSVDDTYERELVQARLKLAKTKLHHKVDKVLIKTNKNRAKLREYTQHKQHIKEIVGM